MLTDGIIVDIACLYYDGDWIKGERTGKGIFIWKDGDRYEGDFEKGKRTG
ncbi:MAG: hypothetical protein IIW83_01385, partial [Clostridia bacterium]|nr:hypothetical protein [Clostridia bacterium]